MFMFMFMYKALAYRFYIEYFTVCELLLYFTTISYSQWLLVTYQLISPMLSQWKWENYLQFCHVKKKIQQHYLHVCEALTRVHVYLCM